MGGGARARLARRGARGRARDRQDAPGKGVRPHGARAGRDGAGGQLPRGDPRSLPAVRAGAAPLHRLLPSGRAGRAGHPAARAARRDRARARGLRAPRTGRRGLGAEQERFRLFEAVSSLLADAAHLRPLVLFLDDLHWADQSSLLLLRHLARSAKGAPLMVLGTYRPVEVERRASARRSARRAAPRASAGAAVVVGTRRGRGRRADRGSHRATGAARVRAPCRGAQRGQPVLHRGAAARRRRGVRLGCGGGRRAGQRQGPVAAPPARSRR